MPLDGALSPSTTLLRIADHLETVPDEKFDMKFWGRTSDRVCAIGHAIRAGILDDGDGFYSDVYKYLEHDLGMSKFDIKCLFDADRSVSRLELVEEIRRKAHELATV